MIATYGVNSRREMFDPSYVSPYGFSWDFPIPDNYPAKKYADNNERITRIHLNRVITAPPENFEAAWEDFQKEVKTIDPESFEQYLTSAYRSRAKKGNAPDF